jgi:hypothetical protein
MCPVIERSAPAESSRMRCSRSSAMSSRASHTGTSTGRPVRLKLPEVGDAASRLNAEAALLRAVAADKLTPEEAEPVYAMLGAHLKTVETVDIDRRLRELESKSAIQK